jgi:CRISPR/Cas system type I-B associated protein Csh2 (Cas7 group RAMP superfamily)
MSRTEEEYEAMRDVAWVCMQRKVIQEIQNKILINAGDAMMESIKTSLPDTMERRFIIELWEKAKQPPQV